jgi:preprotein translocase subunit SecG
VDPRAGRDAPRVEANAIVVTLDAKLARYTKWVAAVFMVLILILCMI